ncbi:MAG TPA: hypothetical protein VFE33_19405 [Thermoanaerobaculia bacterium]|nr:hypothetical protein [Thermoanaerobaculia bacterium]
MAQPSSSWALAWRQPFSELTFASSTYRRHAERLRLAPPSPGTYRHQVKLWRTYCYSQEPEEFFTKIGFIETRSYVRRVLTSWSQYTRIYP